MTHPIPLRSLASLAALFVLAAAAAAQPRVPAELFPAGTLAYAELPDPAGFADTLAAIVKGTPLEEGLKLLHDRRDANADPRFVAGHPALAAAVTLASPEFLAELRQVRGAAVGLTGFTKTHHPKLAAVVLLGDGSAGLLASAYLATEPTLRRVATVEGVPVFQSRGLTAPAFDENTGRPLPPRPAKATAGPFEPTFAYTPGLFVAASNVDAVADVLAGHRGKLPATLGGVAESQTGRAKGTVNVFARPPELAAAFQAARKAGGEEFIDPLLLGYLRLVLNAKAVPVVSGSLTLTPDGLAASLSLTREAKQPSPLLDGLDAGVSPDQFRSGPADIAAAVTFALPKPADRTRAVLALADAVATADGEAGKLPSDHVAGIEVGSKLPLRDRLLPAVRAVSLQFPARQELAANVGVLPVVALHLESDAAANDWAAAVLPLLAAARPNDPPPTPGTETIGGVVVMSIPDPAGTVHFARVGTTLVVARDRKCVAASCTHRLKSPPIDTLMPLSIDSGTAAFGVVRMPSVLRGWPSLVGRVRKTPDRVVADFRLDFGRLAIKTAVADVIPLLEKLIPSGPAYDPRLVPDR